MRAQLCRMEAQYVGNSVKRVRAPSSDILDGRHRAERTIRDSFFEAAPLLFSTESKFTKQSCDNAFSLLETTEKPHLLRTSIIAQPHLLRTKSVFRRHLLHTKLC